MPGSPRDNDSSHRSVSKATQLTSVLPCSHFPTPPKSEFKKAARCS